MVDTSKDAKKSSEKVEKGADKPGSETSSADAFGNSRIRKHTANYFLRAVY